LLILRRTRPWRPAIPGPRGTTEVKQNAQLMQAESGRLWSTCAAPACCGDRADAEDP
jgi:hypothetical protein